MLCAHNHVVPDQENRATSVKEPASRKASGLAHLLTALHQNAAAVVNSKTQLNGPDQVRVASP